MTTRRRRAGSDSTPIDIGESEHQQVQSEKPPPSQLVSNPLFASPVINSHILPGYNQLPRLPSNSFVGPTTASQQEAYYKKTDNPALFNKPVTPNIFTPPSDPINPNHQTKPSFVNNFQGISQGISNYFNPIPNQFFQPASTFSHSTQNLEKDYCEPGELDIPSLGSLNGIEGIEDITVMAFRDRTAEFVGIIKKSQQQGPHGYSNGVMKTPASRGARDLSHYSSFMKHSRMVGRNISSTYAKLEKLTLLARKRSLFDDSQDMEVQELTAIIRHDLTSLTKQLEDLRRSSSASSASSTSHMQKHSANLVGSLQTKVATITQKFRDVLEVRTENLKKQAERREQFTGGTSSGAVMAAGGHQASVLLADEAKATAAARRTASKPNGDVVLDFDGVSVAPSNSGGAYQQQLALMEEQDSLLQSRAETMKTIESTIVELGTMFTQLAAMVKEQDELVHRIDANVDDAEMNVEAAHAELLKYFRSVSSNRWMMFKVFGIVIIFFIIFVVFMA
ncbi:syntaxin-5 [Hyalella azteca]|uniref:Syntaxin-5 n=1 Tax=Hyalella azteca TaxID=294128 RepID=A0A8B7NIV9_HYAAZ|nr:syntaxin-5 [Hyalella azteca]